MAQTLAALGFKPHTGWAACVAVAISPRGIAVLARHRAALLPDDGSISHMVYHEAAELDAAHALDVVKRAEQVAAQYAEVAVAKLLDDVRSQNATVHACGVIVGSRAVGAGTELTAILRAHPLVHAAEGRLFQEAILAACKHHKLPVTAVSERDVWAAAAQAAGCDIPALRAQVDALRTSVGPPWTTDQKSATAAALAARGPQSHRPREETRSRVRG